MQDFSLVVHHDPEWLCLAVPAIIPLEISFQGHLDFENGSCDWLALEVNIEVRDVASELV